MSPPPVTLSVIGDRLTAVQAQLAAIEKNLKTVNEQALDRRVTKLEGSVTWLIRTIAGSIIVAAVGALFAYAGG